jgi:hypothetical protein
MHLLRPLLRPTRRFTTDYLQKLDPWGEIKLDIFSMVSIDAYWVSHELRNNKRISGYGSGRYGG